MNTEKPLSLSASEDLSITELRGKQSVRATFRLSDRLIDLLRVAANHLGVKQKSLIDEIIQNRHMLEHVVLAQSDTIGVVTDRRQKTFVMSRSSLACLDDIAKKHTLSRDHLVELCISRLIPLVDAEQEKHEARRALIADIEQYLDQGKQLVKVAEKKLGHDDSFREKLAAAITLVENTILALRKDVKTKDSLTY